MKWIAIGWTRSYSAKNNIVLMAENIYLILLNCFKICERTFEIDHIDMMIRTPSAYLFFSPRPRKLLYNYTYECKFTSKVAKLNVHTTLRGTCSSFNSQQLGYGYIRIKKWSNASVIWLIQNCLKLPPLSLSLYYNRISFPKVSKVDHSF